MANNVFGGQPNAVVAKAPVSFATAGITSTNTSIIYKVGNPLLSYVPGRSINGITGFETDAGYYMVMLQSMDLTAYLAPPTAGVVTPTLLPHASSFTGTDGTALPSYVPEAGQAWANESGTWQISGGRALPLSGSMPTPGWIAKTDVGAADIQITTIAKVTTLATDAIQIGARWTSATDQVLVYIGNNGVTIYDIGGGTTTSIGTGTPTHGIVDRTWVIIVKGSAVTVKMDGTTVATGTIAKTHTGTRVQMTSYAAGAPSNISFASFNVVVAP